MKEGSRYEYFALQEAFKRIMLNLKDQASQIREMINILLLQGMLDYLDVSTLILF